MYNIQYFYVSKNIIQKFWLEIEKRKDFQYFKIGFLGKGDKKKCFF